MDPLTIMAAASAALQLAKQALPLIDAMKQQGEITPDQEQKIRDEYNALRADTDSLFEQPHWKL